MTSSDTGILAGSRVPRLLRFGPSCVAIFLPDEARTALGAANDTLSVGDHRKAEQAIRLLQDGAATAIRSALAVVEEDEQLRRRMLMQIGTPHAYDDATILMRALIARDALATFAAHLPLHIPNLAEARIEQVKILIDQATTVDADMFLPALIIVMGRLAAPWQLNRFGVRAAGTSVAARVAARSYGVTVTSCSQNSSG
jgi:hypothetical protein